MALRISKSALIVLDFLRKNGPMAPKEISKKSEVPLRTVSMALRRLLACKVCLKIPNLLDMRQPLYTVDAENAKVFFSTYGRVMM